MFRFCFQGKAYLETHWTFRKRSLEAHKNVIIHLFQGYKEQGTAYTSFLLTYLVYSIDI